MTTWRDALRAQARSDFGASAVLGSADAYASQTTMLLQVAWEKLAKAALVSGGHWDPRTKSHKVAAKFASVLKKRPRIEAVFELTSKAAAAARLTWLQGELEALEALTPALAPGEGRDAAGQPDVRWPAEHLTRRFCAPRQRGGVHLRKDFEAVDRHFDRLF